MNGKDESESLKELLEKFFKEKQIKTTLKFISDKKIYGCEKWLQIELMRFLSENGSVISDDICKEEGCDYDKRKELEYAKQRIDLTFRVKNKQYYHAIELKHCRCFSITSVEKDLLKLGKAKPLHKCYFRKIFSVLLHPFNNKETILRKLKAREFGGQFEFSLIVPSTELSCSVFSTTL